MKMEDMHNNPQEQNENLHTEETPVVQGQPVEQTPVQNTQNPAGSTPSAQPGAWTQPSASEQPQPQQGQQAYTQSAQPQTPYGQNAYGQNPYGSNGNGQNPYTPNNGNGQNPYGQQYHAYQPWGAGGNGQISYAPVQKARTKKKGGAKKAAIAVACCAGLLLSAGCGFFGASLANRMYGAGNVVADGGATVPGAEKNESSVGGTAVLYKSVNTVPTSTSGEGGDLSRADVAELVKNSVVEIYTEYMSMSAWFQYVSGGAGSGVVISEDGYILTNNHVICSDDGTTVAETIKVRMTDGSEYTATCVGADSDADIAVLKIDATGLTPAVLGNSDSLAVGEEVLAVGNPLGQLGGSVTNGIISALDREIDVNGTTMNLLQTNATVNPGNSGGGLFNMRGELVGVVNAKSSGENVEGLGFAIPVNDAVEVAEQLIQFGYVKNKPMIGVTMLDVTDRTWARYLGVSNYGVYVVETQEGYNDEVLMPGDRILSVNGTEISTKTDVANIVKKSKVGDVLKFQLYRNGKLLEVDVTCYEKTQNESQNVEFQHD